MIEASYWLSIVRYIYSFVDFSTVSRVFLRRLRLQIHVRRYSCTLSHVQSVRWTTLYSYLSPFLHFLNNVIPFVNHLRVYQWLRRVRSSRELFNRNRPVRVPERRRITGDTDNHNNIYSAVSHGPRYPQSMYSGTLYTYKCIVARWNGISTRRLVHI